MQSIASQLIATDPILKQFDAARQNLWRAYSEEHAIDAEKLGEMLAVIDTCARERRQEIRAGWQALTELVLDEEA